MSEDTGGGGNDERLLGTDEGLLAPVDAGNSGESSLTALLLDDRYSDILAIILRALPDR